MNATTPPLFSEFLPYEETAIPQVGTGSQSQQHRCKGLHSSWPAYFDLHKDQVL